MMEKKHFFKLNNKGVSLVMVIIVIGFIGILAGTVMMTSLVSYKMKRVNVYAKDTFYSAEQVLDEINIGLQRYISDSMSAAYMEVMENYSEYSVQKKRNVLQTNYYERMWDKLNPSGSNQEYAVSVLDSFLKSSTKWDDDAKYGAIVYAADSFGNVIEGGKGTMTTYDNGIILKGVKVYYKDSKGYVSVIQTDIRLTYPEMDFAQTTVLPEVSSYGVIADKGLEASGTAPLLLNGNFYLDSFAFTGTRPISHVGNGKLVVKHDMKLTGGSFKNEETGTVWAKNIEIKGTTLSLNGETYVADDLNIKGDKSSVSLSGIYNGFGNSIVDADESSAILINGTNSSIDLSGIEKITLAGHAYVGIEGKETLGNSDSKKEHEVFTGESIAVKSNQLMYLVPPECIGVDKESGESAYNKNPLTGTEHEEITKNADKYDEVSLNVKVKKLDNTLTEYISQSNGVAVPEKVFMQAGEQSLVYYYMKFDNEEAANRYFAKYYTVNKETYDSYIKYYVEMLQFPTTATVTRIKLAANGVYGSAKDGYYMLPYTVEGASTQLADNQAQYHDRFEALYTMLTEDHSKLASAPNSPEDDPDASILFINLINEDELSGYINDCGGGDIVTLTDGQGKIVLSKSEETYEISDPDVHLVITRGDVKINVHNYTGTVFAKGKVTLTDDVLSVQADEEKVNALLRHYEEIDGQNVMVAKVLQEAEDYMFAIEDAQDTQRTTTTMADLIIYENWKKE